jgi:hypothetical protein
LLLGPTRSLRIVRAISQVGVVQASTVANTGRRQVLQYIPGVAAGAFLLSGGVANRATAGILGRSDTKITALEAVQRTYGITPSDLLVTVNEVNAAAVIRTSANNARVTALLDRLKVVSYKVAAPQAQKVEVPLNRSHPERANPVADMVRYGLVKGGKTVGYATYVSGPKGDLLLATARRADGSIEVLFDNKGRVERAVFDQKGHVVTASTPLKPAVVPESSITCFQVCSTICTGGAPATVAACIASCLAAGPAEIVCAPLCAILVGVGCLFGCSDICCACCNQC